MLNIINQQGMQIKTTVRRHLAPIRQLLSKEKTQKSNVDKDVEKVEPSYIVGKSVKWGSHYGNSTEVLQKLKTTTGSGTSTSGHVLK